MPFGLRTWVDPGNRVLDGESRSPMGRGSFDDKKSHCKYMDFLPWAMQEWLNWSICYVDCGLGWAEKCTSSIVFARWRQCAHMGRHIGATWRMHLNSLSAPAMRSYVKLLWPFVAADADANTTAATVNINQTSLWLYCAYLLLIECHKCSSHVVCFIQCKVKGCPYVAAPRLVQIHYDFVSFWQFQYSVKDLFYLKLSAQFLIADWLIFVSFRCIQSCCH